MTTSNVSSRLARHEQKKLVRQTIILIGASVILLFAFLFVILPQSIRLIGFLTGSNTISDPTDTFPPQVPVLSAPPTATPSAQLNLDGYGEPASEVVLIVNAAEQSRHKIGDDGRFSAEVSLNEGENTISSYAIDANKNESTASKSWMVIKDSQPPKLEVSEPQPDQQIELRRNQQLSVKGMTDPNTKVYVNGRLAFTQADGQFSSSFQLQEGDNKLQFRVEDQAGNVTESEVNVKFRL